MDSVHRYRLEASGHEARLAKADPWSRVETKMGDDELAEFQGDYRTVPAGTGGVLRGKPLC